MTKSKNGEMKNGEMKSSEAKLSAPKEKSSKPSQNATNPASSGKEADQFSINKGFNMFDSDMYEDMRHFWSKCNKSSNNNFYMSTECMTDNNKNSQKIMNNMKDVMIKATNQNIQVCIESLSCKTAADFADLYHKAFNAHFDNISKLCKEAASFCHHCHDSNHKHMAECLKG